MVGRIQTLVSTSVLFVALLFAVPPVQGGSATYCEASTGLGDASDAKCDISVPQCSGTCITYDITITVTADPLPDGVATQYVAGNIAGDTVCSGLGSCTGTQTFTELTFVGVTFECEGTGIEGLDLPHTATSLSITCERTVA